MSSRNALAVIFVLTAALASALGFWQVRRGAEKRAWIADMRARLAAPPVPLGEALADPEAFAFRRVLAVGRFAVEESVLLDHQARGSVAGVHVLTPLAVEDRDALLLVDRGFVPASQAERLLESDLPEEAVRVEGVLRPLAAESLDPGVPEAGERRLHWNRIHLGALERQVGEPLERALLVRAPGPDGELPAGELPEPVSRVDHGDYAITWFAIAAIALALAGAQLRRTRGAAQ